MTREGDAALLAPQRWERILDEVRRSGGVRVSELVQLLGVSDMTVRRDLEQLERQGLIDKVHGGATARQQRSLDEPGFEAKATLALPEKEAIGRRAAAFVEPGMAIALTAGTTTHALAAHLGDIEDLTVITNSMRVAELLHKGPAPVPTVLLTGGMRTPSDALVGPIAVAALRVLHVDLMFMGVHGMSERTGFTTPNLMECETNQAMIDCSQRLIVLADHTKWETRGLSSIAPLDACDILVTDTGLQLDAHTTLAQHIPEIVLAEPHPRLG